MMMTTTTLAMTMTMMMIMVIIIIIIIIIIICYCYLNKGTREYRRIFLVHSDDELDKYHTQVLLLRD